MRSWVLPSYSADVSVIIVNYNTREMLERTLDTLIRSEQGIQIEVVVIDNDSRDGSADMVRTKFPAVVCVANSVNLGHTGGCNQGMALARGRHLYLLNSDTMMRPRALGLLSDYLDSHSAVGAAAGKVLNPNGTIQGTVKSFPTPWAALFGRYSILTRLLPNNRYSRKYLAYRNQKFDRPFAAETVSACAIMVRREAIEKAGPMDTRYFLYWNDTDWCRAIWEAGFEIHVVPDAIVVHDQHKGGTRAGLKRCVKSAIDFHLGAYKYYRKWHIRSVWRPANFIAIAGLSARAAVVVAAELAGWVFGLQKKES